MIGKLGIKHCVWNYSGVELQLDSAYRVIGPEEIEKVDCIPCAIVIKDACAEQLPHILHETVEAMRDADVNLATLGVSSKQIPVLKTIDGELFFRVKSETKSKLHARNAPWQYGTKESLTKCLN